MSSCPNCLESNNIIKELTDYIYRLETFVYNVNDYKCCNDRYVDRLFYELYSIPRPMILFKLLNLSNPSSVFK